MSIVSFDDILKRMETKRPDGLEAAQNISEIELMWQTALVNLQKENSISDDGRMLVGLNRFFEFDAGRFQPIFKAVRMDYKACLYDLWQKIGTGDHPNEGMQSLLHGLRKPAGLREGNLNIFKPKGSLCTSWAIDRGHLSTVVLIRNWDLWRDAVRDAVEIFILHLAIARVVNTLPGPISFVCNRITLHSTDICVAREASRCFREMVQFHADVCAIRDAQERLQMKFEPQMPDESEEDLLKREAEFNYIREHAEKTLDDFRKNSKFRDDIVEAYFDLQLYAIDSSVVELCLDTLLGINIPTPVTLHPCPVVLL